MNRSDIYRVIDGERAYQGKVWGEGGERRTDGDRLVKFPGGVTVYSEDGNVEQYKTVGEFLTYMRHYLSRADAAASTQDGNEPALHEMRKVVALGVACFEQHGVPAR